MHTDRGLQAAVGVVVAFSILWTFAILLLDDSSSSSTASVRQYKRDGLVVDGNHYVLDSNFLIDQVSSDQDYKVIHAVKVKPPKNIMRKLNIVMSDSSASTEAGKTTETQSASKENDPVEGTQPKVSSFTYAWLVMFIAYNARNFLKKKNSVGYDEDFFAKTGLDDKLEYGLEYEDDYSVDRSYYGSVSNNWNELQKFDLDDDHV